MTTTYHTPIPTSPAQPANASTVNGPLSELDAELVAQDGRISALEADMPVPSGVASEFYDGTGGFSVPSGTGSTNGHVVQDEGVALTQRVNLNFTGAGVTVVDTPSATEVQISVSDHGALTGLTDADHVAGSIAFTATDKLLGRSTSGAGAGEEIPLTAAGRALIAAADAAAQNILLEIKETVYKIAPTVATNHLTLTLTHMDGTTPSTSRPLWFRIGDAWRAVTGALAVTVNAAVNTFNAGSAELATKEVDYFSYVSWRAASSAVVLGFGRIPFASLYSDFSGTATDNKYAAFSTAPASGDDVVNIGRFAATLSAGAGYTWTVPTFDNSNLRHVPTFETRWLTWIPTISGYSANPTDTVYIYRVNGRMCEMNFREATAGTSNNAAHTYTAPFTAATRTNMVWSGGTFVPLDNSANVANGIVSLGSASNSISFQLSARAGHTASGSSRIQWANMAFEV